MRLWIMRPSIRVPHLIKLKEFLKNLIYNQSNYKNKRLKIGKSFKNK